MAAVNFSGVLVLCKKAVAANNSGRYARAAEQYGAAADAVLPLELPADNLVHTYLEVERATVLYLHADLPGVEAHVKLDLVRRTLSILDAAAPVLLRRRASCMLPSAGWSDAEHVFVCAHSKIELDMYVPNPVAREAMVGRWATCSTSRM